VRILLRLLSCNVHYGQGVDGKGDLERPASVIRSVEPDFAAIQEVDVRTRRPDVLDVLLSK
jgi:endonuclease/exonuclease/phosphatase family metal-dependent hydrolase